MARSQERMARRIVRHAAVAACLSAILTAQQDPPPATREAQALLARHCAECHRGAEAEKGFVVDDLLAADAEVDAAERAARAGKALLRLRSRTMPPPDAAQPTAAERSTLATALAALQPDSADARVPAMRRLSRIEYRNTVRDVFGISWDGLEQLPEDAVAYGFDNMGDVATVSPLAFEKYHDVAATVATAVLADPAAAARVFADGEPVARSMERLLARAFRRPALAGEIGARVALHYRLAGDGVEPAAIRHALLRSVLASPSFVFRTEQGTGPGTEAGGDAGAPQPLLPHELAVRLSYLLTGTMPDDALRGHADRGTLMDSAVLRAEARRLVAGNAGRALAERFGAQWLGFDLVLQATADFRVYPQVWNHALRPSFREEAVQFFAAMVRDDTSVLELLDAKHTFLDETLSKHYGIGAVQGRAFVRVELPDRRRGGVLGMGAMLMSASHSGRTSPVLRGRWILDRLLDLPPPPPPPNVGELPKDDKPVDGLSLRARLEQHRAKKSCASCHAQIDPLGFALENYDVVGLWRTELHGQPVDARGELQDGTVVDGPVALRDALLARKDDFVRTFALRLLVFAIGRPLHGRDEPELQRIAQSCIDNDHRTMALLDAVVTSPLFTHRDPGARP